MPDVSHEIPGYVNDTAEQSGRVGLGEIRRFILLVGHCRDDPAPGVVARSSHCRWRPARNQGGDPAANSRLIENFHLHVTYTIFFHAQLCGSGT